MEAIAGALAGAAVTGGAMAGAAAISQLAVALHRMGVPKARLRDLHEAVRRGHYVLVLRCGSVREAEHWQPQMALGGAEVVEVFPLMP